jgi:transcriptional regulator with XRE-family HTH domain
MKYKQNIKRYRDKHGFNNKTLAIAAGLGETAIRDILQKTKNDPRVGTIYKIANALGVSVFDILEDTHIIDENKKSSSDKTSCFTMANGKTVDVRTIDSYDRTPLGHPILCNIDNNLKICIMKLLGVQLVLNEVIHLGELGPDCPYTSKDSWDSGLVSLHEREYKCDILGVVARMEL